jgi:hypothetical protein
MSYGTVNSHSAGDLQILDRQGHLVMLFSQIANPQNINSLIQAEMKTMQYNLKELKYFVFGHEKEKYNASGMIRITILPVTGKSHLLR